MIWRSNENAMLSSQELWLVEEYGEYWGNVVVPSRANLLLQGIPSMMPVETAERILAELRETEHTERCALKLILGVRNDFVFPGESGNDNGNHLVRSDDLAVCYAGIGTLLYKMDQSICILENWMGTNIPLKKRDDSGVERLFWKKQEAKPVFESVLLAMEELQEEDLEDFILSHKKA
jgi:hypothetical protein